MTDANHAAKLKNTNENLTPKEGTNKNEKLQESNSMSSTRSPISANEVVNKKIKAAWQWSRT